MDGAPPILSLRGVSKSFDATRAVDAVSIDVAPGEFFALLGASGSGKTTLMRIAAGFEPPDEGRVLIEGADVTDAPPHRRPVNMMFQSYALFPHMSVADNIAFGLRRAGTPRVDVAARVADMVRLVQLQGLEQRKPDQLSGGQRQRTALARALARQPRLLLLDEPLAALDRKLREETQFELMDIQRRLGTAFVVVTHDQDEAMSMADRIAVMRAGRIEQIGAPVDVYERPATRYVAEFIGEINLFEGDVTSARDGCMHARTREGPMAAKYATGAGTGAKTLIAVRPERMAFVRDGSAALGPDAVNRVSGIVQDFVYRGDRRMFRVRSDNGALLRVSAPAVEDAPPQGARVVLAFEPAACVALDA